MRPWKTSGISCSTTTVAQQPPDKSDAAQSIPPDTSSEKSFTEALERTLSEDDDWGEAFQKEIQVSQEEENEVEETCGLRAESESESEASSSSTSGSSLRFLTTWWAQTLFKAVTGLQLSWPRKRSSPLRVISGCTGCSAEAAVLKAWGMGGTMHDTMRFQL